MNKIIMQFLQSVLFIAISAWLALSVLFYFMQSSFIYYPFREIIASPSDVGLQFKEVFIDASETNRINGWYVPHDSALATLLFFHGNGGNISHRLEKISLFNQIGLNVFIIDYRGYGLSTGKTTESGTYRDAELAYAYLTDEMNISPEKIIIYGESLGAAVGSWLASRHTSGALILDSAFTSIQAIGKHYYPYLPVNLIARIRYPTIRYLESITSPLLIIHSVEDDIIPFSHGMELFNSANEPKSILKITGDHNNGFYTSGKLYIEGIHDFIKQWY